MSIAEMQSFLARLYVDGAFLRLFTVEPAYVLEQYDLNAEEREAVSGLDPKLLTIFAGSLKKKRKGRFEHAYPLCFKLGGPAAERYYDRFCELRRFKPNESFLTQALDLGEFFEESFATNTSLPPFASAIAKFERILFATRFAAMNSYPANGATGATIATDEVSDGAIRASRPKLRPGVHLATFPLKIKALVDSMAQGEETTTELGAACFYYVFSPIPRRNAKTSEVTEGSYALLTLCDGERTAGDLVSDIQRRYQQDGLEGGILANVRKLSRLGIIEI